MKRIFRCSRAAIAKQAGLAIAGYCLLNSLSLPAFLAEYSVQWDQAAYAKRSGGRSRGGSFNQKSSPSNSGGSSDRSRSLNNGGSSVYVGPSYGGYGYGGGYSTPISGGLLLLIALIVVGGIGFAVWYVLWANKGKSANRELDNDIVTVSKIQVALLAEGKAIQPQLAEIVANADFSTAEGLQQHVQEAALALLRMPENWSHVQTRSETLKSRDEGKALFEQWSIAERSKYTEETLTNVEGKLIHKEYEIDVDKEPASYIVVTLLIGTADDKPLFEAVRTAESLKAVLGKIASINSDYLLVFELLWTPEAEGDSLTYDEMLTEYTDMLQI